MNTYFCNLQTHDTYMNRCLQLAALGAGHTAPNPLVGAVLVYNNHIIGEGYHKQYGGPHAEVNCINSVAQENKKYIAASTLYVSLEPCVHFGKTPPCTNLILKNKIPTVVIGCRDSFAAVNGKGIEKLENAGVDVVFGIMETECLHMNKRFFTFHKKQRPYIILKWAQSNDGFIAASDIHKKNIETKRLLISNEITNRLVHKWRSREAAIMVGTQTALLDNPSLTTRLWPGNNPLRLVIDKELILPPSLKLFDESAKTIVFNYTRQSESKNLVYQLLEKEENVLTQILSFLFQQQIQSLIVEGGTKLIQSFIDEGLWDEARVITNKEMKIENGVAAPILKNNLLLYQNNYSTDTVSYFKRIQN